MEFSSINQTGVVDDVGTGILDGNAPARPWLSVPTPTAFWVPSTVWKVATRNIYRSKPTLFVGPTGCGKTELIALLAGAMGRVLHSVNMGATTDSRSALIGTTHFREGQTVFTPSRFAAGLQDERGLILLDEISRADHEANHLLFSILDGQGYVSMDETYPPSIIRKHRNVVVFATANVGEGYTGTRELDRALKDRFVILELDYPPPPKETQILVSRTGIAMEDAEALVAFAREARDLWRRGDLSGPVSTRMLIETAGFIADGIDRQDALAYGIFSFFDASDGAHSERSRIHQLAARF